MSSPSVNGLRERLGKARSSLAHRLDGYYASTPPYALNAWDRLAGLAVFLFFFVLYLYTCGHGPNIAGDSPELIAGTYSLGILHPPGYPLFTLLGYLFTRLPFGSIAFRVNLSSVLFHSLTLLVVYLSALKMTRSRAASSIATAVLGFSSVFWFYAQIAEVFPLNSLFVALLIYVAIRAREEWLRGNSRGCTRRMVLLAGLAGLSLTHHHTIIFVFPALLLFLPRQLLALWRRPSLLAACMLAFLAGLLPYLYLPLRASQEPFMNFLNPSTFQNFKDSITRAYYGSSRLWIGPGADHRIDLVFYFINGLYWQVHLLGLTFGVFGMFHAAKRRIGDFLPLFTAFFLSAVVFALLANVKVQNAFERSTIERFFIMPTIILCYFIAMGLSAASKKLRELLDNLASVRDDIKKGLVLALGMLVVALFCLPASKTASAVNLKYDPVGEAFIKNLTASLEDGSVLFVTGDVPVFLMEYYEVVQGDEKDLTILIYPFLDQSWYFSHVRKYASRIYFPTVEEIRADITDDPTKDTRSLVAERIINGNPQVPAFYILHTPVLDESLEFQPRGISFKLVPRDAPFDPEEYYEGQLAYYGRFIVDGLSDSFYTGNRRELDLLAQIAAYPYELGKYLAGKGEKERALFFFSYTYQLYPAPEVLKRMADTYAEISIPEEAYRYLDLYVNSGTYSTINVWDALMDMEDMLAEGRFGDAR